jgi:hypothetical protein
MAAPVIGGCIAHLSPATGALPAVDQPVLLGPVDHIGGGPAFATTKVREFDGEAKASFGSSTSGGTTTDVTIINNAELNHDALAALSGTGENADIRVTTLRAWGWGYIVKIKNTVYVAGDVVTVGAAK